MAENKKIAQEIVDAIGGNENIISAAHCATRLRIMVNDREKIDQEAIENIDKVKGAFFNSGQYQVILGTGTVNRVYEALNQLEGNEGSNTEPTEAAPKQGNMLQRAIRALGDVFVPIIPVLVATGLFMGLRGLVMQDKMLVLFGLTAADISYNFLLFTEILSNTAFIFLPALVAWSAFTAFNGTPIIGLVFGLMLVSPALPNAWGVAEGADPLYFLDFIPVVGYQGAVLPAFIAGILGAKLERTIRKRVPESLDLIITPFLTLLIMITASLFIIGPIFHAVEEYILSGTLAVLSLPFGLAGLLIGLLHQIIVITGVHHIFNLLEIQLLERFGNNPFNAIITAFGAAILLFRLSRHYGAGDFRSEPALCIPFRNGADWRSRWRIYSRYIWFKRHRHGNYSYPRNPFIFKWPDFPLYSC